MFNSNSDAIVKNCELFDTNGELSVNANFGGFLANPLERMINCTFYSYVSFAIGTYYINDEKTFDLKVIDNKTNYAIENADVRLLDKNGYSALWEETGARTDASMLVGDTTMSVDDYAQLSVGDIIIRDGEVMEVTVASSNPVTVTRAQQGTTARPHPGTLRDIRKQQYSIQTDSSGDIVQKNIIASINLSTSVAGQGGSNQLTYFTPHRLIITKSGYKKIDMPLKFGVGTQTSDKNEFIKEIIKLEPHRFREERSIP